MHNGSKRVCDLCRKKDVPIALWAELDDGRLVGVCYRCANDRDYDKLMWRMIKLDLENLLAEVK